MNDTKITSGPWKRRMYNVGIADTGDVDGVVDVVDGHDKVIAYVQYGSYSNDHSDDECEANGSLIAAAPEMYEALSQLVHLHICEQEGIGCGMPTYDQWEKSLEKAYFALGKARSEHDQDVD